MKKNLHLFILCTASFLIASAQNIGIGTVSPAAKLEINSGMPSSTGLRFTQLVGNGANSGVATQFATVPSATGVAFDNNGNLYVTSFSENKVYKINSGGVTDFVTVGLNGPHDIIMGPDGNLYVSNYNGNSVSKIALSGFTTTFATGFSNPIGLTFDNYSNLYVSNAGNGQLSKVTIAGAIVSYAFGTGLSSPYNCVFSAATNKIYVSNYGASEIAQIDVSSGGPKTTFAQDIFVCTGIALDGTGNLYVAQAGANKISKISPAAVSSLYANTTYPFDITFDSKGNLFVANQTINSVSKISPVSSTLLGLNNMGDVVKVDATSLTNDPLKIGDSYGGGIVFYLSADGHHGLIAERKDLYYALYGNTTFTWYDAFNVISDPSYHTDQGWVYLDWRLPTAAESALLYAQKFLVGGFTSAPYWTSIQQSATDATLALFYFFSPFATSSGTKTTSNRVRAVRSF